MCYFIIFKGGRLGWGCDCFVGDGCVSPILKMNLFTIEQYIFRQDVQDLQDGESHLYSVNPVHPVHYHSNMGIGFYFF